MNQLKWTIVEDGYFVPNGIVSKHDLVYNANRMLVIQSTFWRKQAHGWVNHLAAEAPSVLPQHPGEEETTDTLLFLGPYKTHQSYGHWITEGLARFWYLLHPPQTGGGGGKVPVKARSIVDRVIRLFHKQRFPSWSVAFKAFHLTSRHRFTTSAPTRARIIVPDCSVQLNAEIRPEHLKVTHKIARYLLDGEQPSRNPTPVYLSRTRAKNTSRSFANEQAIEEFCRQRRFKIIYPEQLSLRNQVRVFNAHDVFVGIQGSAFHSTLFRVADRKAHHVYLSEKNGPTYALIDALVGNSWHLIPCASPVPGEAKRLELDARRAIDGIARQF